MTKKLSRLASVEKIALVISPNMSNENLGDSVENLLTENRTFPPTSAFAAQANAKPEIYGEAERDRLAFWEKQARRLHWHTEWSSILDWQHRMQNGLSVEN